MKSGYLSLALFIIGVVGIGSLIGMQFPPGPWHESLIKPWFNPPGWIFAPVWTTLYILIGIAGWRVFTLSRDGLLRNLWIGQMVLNFAWSPAFFGAQSTLLGLIVIVPMLVLIIWFILRARETEPVSAVLFLPYLAWVSFATILTASIWWLN